MKEAVCRATLMLAAVALGACETRSGAVLSTRPRGSDLRPSDDGRYLVGPDGKPFFWLGDTTYLIWSRATLEQAEAYLTARKRQGFTVIKTYALDPNFAPADLKNTEGTPAFLDVASGRLNPAYFAHADTVADRARALGLHIVVVFDLGPLQPSAQREVARWWGARWSERRELIWWTMNGFNASDRDIIEGVMKGVTGLDISWDAENPAWRALLAAEYAPLSAQLWRMPWATLKTFTGASRVAALRDALPAKPVVWGNGQYEDGSDTSPDVLNHVDERGVRAGAWSVALQGGAYTYGRPQAWGFDSGWQNELESPGARAVTVYAGFWRARSWWRLLPAPDSVERGAPAGTVAARNADGNGLYVYAPSATELTVRTAGTRWTGSPLHARWLNLQDGSTADAGTVGAGDSLTVQRASSDLDDALLFIEP